MNYTVKKDMILFEFLLIHVSRKQAKLYLKYKQVVINGVPVSQFDYMVHVGDKITITKEPQTMNSTGNLEILYEDKDCVIINKPTGLLSMSGGGQKEKTAYHQVGQYIKSKDPKGKVFIVHRLDRDTSGILLFAKNEQMKNKLQENWNELVEKRGYLAIVEGVPSKKEGTIKTNLDESKTQQVYVCKSGGKLAITHYKVIKETKNNALLEVYLDTGRKNQIRVHMEYMGHSIVGDKKYGATTSPIRRLGLHCHDFTFYHPIAKKQIAIQTEAPKMFDEMFKKR